MLKVYLLQEIIPNYRVPVFNKINKVEGIDLTVFHSEPTKKMAQANLKSASNLAGLQNKLISRIDLDNRSWQLSFLRYLLFFPPDVLVCSNSGHFDRILFQLVCKLRNIRIFWFLGGCPYSDPQKVKEYSRRGRLNRFLGKYNPRRWLWLQADGIIAYSDHAGKYYADQGFPENKIWVAPNSPDTDALYCHKEYWEKNPEKIGIFRKKFCPDNELLVFLLGRLNKGRKADLLIKAIMRVQKQGVGVSLVIIGDGGQRVILEKLVKELSVANVFFEGAIYDDHELSQYFMACDLFVTPGIASMALKMAMLFGKPVITVDHGLEVHAVRNDFNGYIVPEDDSAALAEKIMGLIGNKELRQQMGRAGAELIEKKINVQTMVAGFIDAIT